MKTLKDHVILYDAVCPLCNLYTKGFIQSGMLDKDGRLPYQNLPDKIACNVDQKRFVNEIALLDKRSGRVYYGIESLLRIIENSMPLFRPLFKNQLFVKIADKLYKFISFNRRVISPIKKLEAAQGNFEPAFHKDYRIAFLLFTWLVAALILNKFTLRLGAILPQSNFYREFFVCGGQVLWQSIVIRFMAKRKTWDYLGNLMTISFAGALLLALVMLFGNWFSIQSPFLYAGFFGLVVSLMLAEHIRRTKLLGLDWKLTASWVLYRIVVLLIILISVYVR